MIDILAEVAEERKHQIALGYDKTHDKTHSNDELLEFAIGLLSDVSVAVDYDDIPNWVHESVIKISKEHDRRTVIIKAMALLVAQLERDS